MTRFSANLGFLWNDHTLPDAIRAAHAAGFDAVECHWPYEFDATEVAAALEETGLPMLGLNTIRGNPGENGLSALPGREEEARQAIQQAIRYAEVVDAASIHVMAGFAQGPDAQRVFLDNLRFACDLTDRTILIEPLNRHDAPGYFLEKTDHARSVVEEIDKTNLRLMFDCYHVGRTEGDVVTRLKDLLPIVGHIQIASIPDRGAPDQGELNYQFIFKQILALGWTRPLGAEFKVDSAKEVTDWIETMRP